MNAVSRLLADNASLSGSLRILIGITASGKRSVYISGTPEGLHLLASLIQVAADASDNEFAKLDRTKGELFFTTDDSVEIFEVHNTDRSPEPHFTIGEL